MNKIAAFLRGFANGLEKCADGGTGIYTPRKGPFGQGAFMGRVKARQQGLKTRETVLPRHGSGQVPDREPNKSFFMDKPVASGGGWLGR